jgi:HEAT repeat protein
VRTDAIRALGDIGDPGAVEFLLTVLKDRDLRVVTVEALGKIADRRAVPALRDVITGASRPVDTRPVQGCGDRYDEEMLARQAAVRGLGQIGDPSCLPLLMQCLQDTVVRSEAAAAMTTFGQPAIALLKDVLKTEKDENILFHARESLHALGWRPNRL